MEPFRWTGHVQVISGGLGSGVVIQPNVYATAAHVVFDLDTLSWFPASQIRFEAARHRSGVSSKDGESADGSVRFTAYSDRARDDIGHVSPGSSSEDTFNADFAVVYRMAESWIDDGSYAPSFVDEEEAVSLIRGDRLVTVVGYPVSGIPLRNAGKMHQTEPGHYMVYWSGLTDEPDTHRDSDGLWTATYDLYDVETFGGNSGGPVFVESDMGDYVVNGILIYGGFDGISDYSGARGLDRNAWHLVVEPAAITSSGNYRLLRVKDAPTAVATDHSVTLQWEDTSESESTYVVERQASARFEVIVELPSDSASYIDTEITSGTGYRYRVFAMDADGNRCPPSPPVSVMTKGKNRSIGEKLGVPQLAFTTGGVAHFSEQNGVLTSGQTEAFEPSFIELEIIGPGVLKFDWQVSSEVNKDYNNSRSDYYREIYDAFYFKHNGVRQRFISGEIGPENHTLLLPGGNHLLRWEYLKDPYSDAGLDAGLLHSVSWTSTNSDLYFVGAYLVNDNYQATSWFGYYTYNSLPWSFSFEHGWLYLIRAGNNTLWAYSAEGTLGWIFIDPGSYPFLYSTERGWLYYYRGSGINGTGRWFYDYRNSVNFQMP